MKKIENDFKTERVEGTPFTLLTKNGETKIVIGNQLASADVYDYEEEALKRVIPIVTGKQIGRAHV